MSKPKWSIDGLDYFVTLYRSHECLWNQSLDHESEEKDAAYASIQEKMLKEHNFNLKIEEIKEKISTVRELFLNLKKKYSGNPPLGPNRSKWYKDMEYVMAIYGSELFDKSSGTSKSKSTTKQADLINSLVKMYVYEDVCMSDDEGETTLAEDRSHLSTIKQSTRITILEILKVLYSEKVTPDYLIFMETICKNAYAYDDLGATNLNSLRSIMKGLGFIEKKTICGKTIVVERADQRFERYTYFTKIKTARIIQNRQIVYIDERIADPKLGFDKVHSLKPCLPEDSTIYYHALTRDGLLNGIFSNQATENEFTKWVSTILMSYLKTPSLVIMDRGPLHGELEDLNHITRYSSKAKMIKWLIDNNIPFNEHMARPILYELIRKYRIPNKEYKIDKIFKAHGHKVLRLPCTFPDLNLSHLFWVTVSESAQILKSMPNITQQHVQDKIRETTHSISKNKKKWYEMEKLLMLKENDIYLIDIAIENMLLGYAFKEE